MIKDIIKYNKKEYQVSTTCTGNKYTFETMIFPIENNIVSCKEVYYFGTMEMTESCNKQKDIYYHPEKYLTEEAINEYLKSKKEETVMDVFYTAFRYLENHKIFNDRFIDELYIAVVKVNPDTNEIDDDKTKNTKVQVWLEHGLYEEKYNCCTHDINLDCGGDTFEEAIIELARLVKENYTDDGKHIDKI